MSATRPNILELACMRSLHPGKRDLPFNQGGIDAVTQHFRAHYPTAPLSLLIAVTLPTQGDLTWASFALGNIKGIASGPTGPTGPTQPTKRPEIHAPVAPHPQGVTVPPVPSTVPPPQSLAGSSQEDSP